MPPEDWYFAGLLCMEDGQKEEADRLFTQGIKHGHPLLVPLCRESLSTAVQSVPEEKSAVPYQENLQLESAFAYAEEGNWNRAYDYLESALPPMGTELHRDALLFCLPEELSVIGKILLYGYGDKLSRAQMLQNYAEYSDATPGIDLDNRFLLKFYTGRLFVYAGRQYYENGCLWFENAMKVSPTAQRYDNALWYYLDTNRKISYTAAVTALNRYGSTWYDPLYFEDFLEDLCADLCNKGQWNTLYRVLLDCEGYMPVTMKVQFRYICARAVGENLVSLVDEESRAAKSRQLMETAWNMNGGSVYYRMLLAEKLGHDLFSQNPVDPSAARSDGSKSEDTRQLQDLLLTGYVKFQMFDRILPLCTEYSGTFAPATLSEVLPVLAKVAAENPGLSSFALRSASYSSNWGESNTAFDVNLLPYVYPQYHQDVIRLAAEEFDLDPSLLFGLIRSESYFDASVISRAGAIGLSQLMTPTAGDVARKLKVSEYNLTDPETNARFGAFYLAELIRRLDGDVLLAAMSYNAGITNVRNWRRQVPDLPHDLFLEAVPYEETRGYGRKITTAYGIYAMLYDNASTHEIVRYLRLSQ